MKRPVLLLYGIVSYAAFNISFLYLAGFLLDVGVPKSINEGNVASLGTAAVTNFGLMPTQDRRPLLLPGCRELETVVPLLPWHHRFFRSGGPPCETWRHGISKSHAQGPSKDLSRSRHFPACLGFSFPRPFAR